MTDPTSLNPAMYLIYYQGKLLTHIALLTEFSGSDIFWHIVFESGAYFTLRKKDLKICESCLSEKEAQDKLAYLKNLASIGGLKTDDGESLISKAFEKLDFVNKDTVLASYLYPQKHPIKKLCDGLDISLREFFDSDLFDGLEQEIK